MDVINQVSPQVFDTIGVAGFALYVLNYGLLTFQRLKSEQVAYFALNWLAASFVLVGLMASFNLASALIQVFWIAISTIGIYIRLRRRKPPQFESIRNRGFTAT